MKRVNLFGTSLLLVMFLMMTVFSGCKKDQIDPGPEIPTDDGTLVDVSFSPSLNGEVVPWMEQKKTRGAKGDGTFPFTHRYTGHILRVISGNGEWSRDVSRWVADIPLVPQNADGTGTDTYSHKLPKGNFQARVLPVSESAADFALTNPTIHYSTSNVPEELLPYDVVYLEDSGKDAVFAEASFESDNVPFAIVSTASQTVPLKLFTRQSLVLLDLGPDWQYTTAGVGQPFIQFVDDASYLASSSMISPYALTYAELNTMKSSSTLNYGDFMEDIDNQQYFAYMMPGLKSAYNVAGVHMFAPTAKASYLRFGDETAPTTMPSIWLRDYWDNGELKPNMVVRVKYSVGTLDFSTTRLDWFGENVDIIDGNIPEPEVPMVITLSHTPFTGEGVEDPAFPGFRAGALTATVTGGTDPIMITWWNDALATIPAMNGATQITGVIGYPFNAEGTRYAKAISATGAFVISEGMVAYNQDLESISINDDGTTLSAVVTGGFAPYTYEWKLGSSIVGSASTYTYNSTYGTYFLKVTDASGQILTTSKLTEAPIPYTATINATSGTYVATGEPGAPFWRFAGNSIALQGSALPVGYTGTWTIASVDLDGGSMGRGMDVNPVVTSFVPATGVSTTLSSSDTNAGNYVFAIVTYTVRNASNAIVGTATLTVAKL